MATTRRRIRLIAAGIACLAAGAVVSILVAWGAVLVTHPDDLSSWQARGTAEPDDAERRWWQAEVSEDPEMALLLVRRRMRAGVSVKLLAGSDPSVYGVNYRGGGYAIRHEPRRAPKWTRVLRVDAGWPLHCVSGERLEPDLEKSDIHPFSLVKLPVRAEEMAAASHRGSIPTSRAGGLDARPLLLPLRPSWSGLVVNTLLWTAVALGLLTLPGLLRRGWRHLRGHCPVCGYDLRRTTSPCPECGWQKQGRDSPTLTPEP